MKKLFCIIIFFSQIAQNSWATEKLTFHESFKSCLSPHELWSDFKLAMEDSNKTTIWPNQSSKVSGEGLSKGSTIDVKYKFPFFSRTYSYVLSDVVENKKFTYSALIEKHPFSGGASVEIISQDQGALINWSGEYITSDSQWLQRLIFSNYSKSFF